MSTDKTLTDVQPSPAGQGDALASIIAALENSRPTHSHYPEPVQRHSEALAHARALAAHQPVGQEPVGVATLVHSKHFDKTQCTFMRSDVPEGTKLYAAPDRGAK